MSARKAISCLCNYNYCPNGEANGTCSLLPGGYCFSFLQEVVNVERNELEGEWHFGCLSPDEKGYMQCQGDLSPHEIPKSIKCCQGPDFCNKDLKPMYTSTSKEDFLREMSEGYASFFTPNIILALSVFAVLLLILLVLIFFLIRSIKQYKEGKDLESKGSSFDMYTDDAYDDGGDSKCIRDDRDSSGGTVPLLVQRTVARDIEWGQMIGRGRYGHVMRGFVRGSPVAIKVFQTTEEKSWKREQEIYNTALIRHENILTFYATDIRGTGGVTQMLLITDYHPHGSLYDFLTSHVLNEESALRLLHSISCGLSHLHSEIVGRQSKPAISHRDIKSKNILVKDDMTCCIADFGLSVTFESAKGIDIGDNPRVGTKRYMPPEVLDETINVWDFESYKRADIYCLSLVLWEVCRRVRLEGKEEECQVPYYGFVPNDPSFEDMKAVVNDQRIRPEVLPSWTRSLALKPVVKLMKEGWSHKPKVRPTARKIKLNLANTMESFMKRLQEEESKKVTKTITYNPPNIIPAEVTHTLPDMLHVIHARDHSTSSSTKDAKLKMLNTPSSASSSSGSSSASNASVSSFKRPLVPASTNITTPTAIDQYLLPSRQNTHRLIV